MGQTGKCCLKVKEYDGSLAVLEGDTHGFIVYINNVSSHTTTFNEATLKR